MSEWWGTLKVHRGRASSRMGWGGASLLLPPITLCSQGGQLGGKHGQTGGFFQARGQSGPRVS